MKQFRIYTLALILSLLGQNAFSQWYFETGANDDLTDNDNVFIGKDSGNANTTGYQNVASGRDALHTNTTGNNGIAIGFESQRYTNDTAASWTNTNVSVGYRALRGSTTASNNTGTGNSVFGYQAMVNNTSGSRNVASGYNSLYNNTTGSNNVASGTNALYANTTGINNVASGYLSLRNNTTGNFNVANGYQAGRYIGATGTTPNETGSSNVFIGANTRASADGVSNENVFGHSAIGEGSNTVRIGNSNIIGVYAAVSTTTTSDGRRKKNVETIDSALDKIAQLRGVGYDWKDKETKREFGFIAQEVEEVFPNLVYTKNDEEGTKSLKYDGLIAPLLEAVKELKAENDALKARVEALENK